MDFLEIFLLVFRVYCYIAISLLPLVLYKEFFVSKYKPNSDYYYRKEWYHFLKVLWAIPYISKYKKIFSNAIKKESNTIIEQPRKLTTFMRYDSQTFYGADQIGNGLFIKISLRENRLAELCLQLRLEDGRIYQLPEHPLVLVCSIPNRKWQAGGLEIKIVEPFQTLRICYNGFLRNCIRNKNSIECGEVKHCKFNFIWSAASEPKYFPQDMRTMDLANAVAVEPWKNAKWIKLLGFQTGYDQYGMLLGQIYFSPNTPPLNLRLTSCRKRTWGPSKARTLHRSLTLFGMDPKGTIFNITVNSYINGCKELHIGTMILPNRAVVPIEGCDISLPDFIENGIIPGSFSFRFKAQGMEYNCSAFSCKNSITKVRNNEIKGYKSKLVKTNYMINGEEALGYGIFWYRRQGQHQDVPPYIIRPGVQIVEPEKKYIASLTRPECKSEYLAGIKGTSLALLSSIQTDKFQLLDGFCILVPAFQRYLERNLNIKDALKRLNDICAGIEDGDIGETCDRIKSLFSEMPLSQDFQEEIIAEMKLLKLTSNNEENLKYSWAVRCSSVDEDLYKVPTLRNQSFLDCFSDEDVLKAIVFCWGSSYSLEKVMHRKKYGLPIIAEMAVIIQYSINADSSGILSTCHPETADPGSMIIKANHGIGVSVITKMVEPDTATITRTWNGKLTISHTSIGNKTCKVEISKNGLKKIDNIQRKIFCLSAEQIYRISEVGLLLEKSFGGHKEIEWAIFKDQLYILNIRPIRFQYNWTNYELIHENDTAILKNNDLILANTTENFLPGFSTNLTNSTIVKYLDESLQKIYNNKTSFKTFVLRVLAIYKHQVGTNVYNSILQYIDNNLTEELEIHELITSGQMFLNEKIFNEAKQRSFFYKFKDIFCNFVRNLSYCWSLEDTAKEAKILSKAIRIISYEEYSSFEYFKIIQRNLQLLKKMIHFNSTVTSANIFYQKFLLNFMTDETSDSLQNQLKDILDIYSCDTIYNIPNEIEFLAQYIKNEKKIDDFTNLSNFELWKIFEKFMDSFGHRAVQEFDFKSERWEENISVLRKILEITIKNLDNSEKRSIKDKKNIDGLQQKMNRRFLRWINSKIKDSFKHKDDTLSALSFTINKFRKAFNELAKKLVREGKIPHINLIFYLTLTELEELVARKNPDLIAKALKRISLSKELKKLNFPDLYTGEEILSAEGVTDEIDNLQLTGSLKAVGITAVAGNVAGRALVINNIKQIKNIIAGDILVTKHLDIGWIPYFPVISGIVCEYGIITSQGAIAVRKYNKIPCIINAKNITNIFQTGDKIIINGDKGYVEKIYE